MSPAPFHPPAPNALDAGLTWLARPNLQLDLAAGVRIDGPVPDELGTVGVSFRLPG